MELRVWHFRLDLSKGIDRNVESLMPLETSWEQYNEFPVRSCSCMPGKHLGVNMIDKDRALSFWGRARNYCFMPQVVRHNHVIDKSRRDLFKRCQQPDIGRLEARTKLVREQFRDHIVNVENQFRPSQLWIPGSKHQEIRHVVNVNHVIPIPLMQSGDHR